MIVCCSKALTCQNIQDLVGSVISVRIYNVTGHGRRISKISYQFGFAKLVVGLILIFNFHF